MPPFDVVENSEAAVEIVFDVAGPFKSHWLIPTRERPVMCRFAVTCNLLAFVFSVVLLFVGCFGSRVDASNQDA